ncbi:hypothetical protein ACN47E_004354 [Coniothyrium glycines]
MKITIALFGSLAGLIAAAPQGFPSCSWDPVKGRYICPANPPRCKFDLEKGQYICPALAARQYSFPHCELNLEKGGYVCDAPVAGNHNVTQGFDGEGCTNQGGKKCGNAR